MKKYCIVGASARCYGMFAKTLTENFNEYVSIEGIYDTNITRSRYYNRTISEKIKVFEDFDHMIDTVKPDAVIVTTIDSKHHEYCIRAMEKGCDVICEKPLAIDEKQCREITETERRTGKKVTVTFNCRFMPYYARLKELVMQNRVGKVLNINFEYLLGKWHGGDYFRRWHRKRENSGTLLVHKSTHHLDICTWLLDDTPKTVTALGGLNYFGANRDKKGVRCSDCDHKDSCEYYWDYKADPFLKEFYGDAEINDGYMRDACPFSDEVNIYDNMSLSVRYDKGALVTYTLTTYNPYEGYRISITGTDARIEAEEIYEGAGADNPNYEIKIIKNSGETENIIFPKSGGAHGGGDARLLNMLFKGGIEDKLSQCASGKDGAISALIGICARKSIESGKTVSIADEIALL